jgi:hypothetical protein
VLEAMTVHRRPTVFALPAAVALGLLALAGCDAGGSTPGGAGPAASRPAAASSGTSGARGAVDGRDLKACADAECEVEVRTGDVIHFDDRVARRVGADTLRVTDVGDDGFGYEMRSSDGSVVSTGSQSGSNAWGSTNGVGLHLVSAGPTGVVLLMRDDG